MSTTIDTNKMTEEGKRAESGGGAKRAHLVNELVSPTTAVHQKASPVPPTTGFKPYSTTSTGTIEPHSVRGIQPLRDTSKLSASQSKLPVS